MKFSTIALAALLPAVALTQDARATDSPDSPDGEGQNLDKRYIAGRVVVDGLRYRRCPRTSCTAVGQYAAGAPIQIQCFTRTGTTVENGDPGWAKLRNGYWVAMGYGRYITWYSTLYYC